MQLTDLTLKTQYWAESRARAAFKSFIRFIHNLDFTPWETAGFWDEAYTPFSYFKGDAVIANVCVYLLDAIVDGRQTRLAQISGVGTHPDWRRKGLNRELTRMGLEWASGKHDGVFLFPDADAVPYYRKCGFRPMRDYVGMADIPPVSPCEGAVRLNPDSSDDLEKIYTYACNRIPPSNLFSVMNAKLFMFHVIYGLRNHVYEVPDLNCLVLYKREHTRLIVYDIVGKTMPRFSDIHPFLSAPGDTHVVFHFHTDKLGVAQIQPIPHSDTQAFVDTSFSIHRPVFPATARA